MSDATNPEVVRVSGRDGLLGVIPVLLGFHPQDSAVIVGMKNKRLGPTARIDLVSGWAGPAIAALRAFAGCEAVIIVTYSDRAEAWDTVDVEAAAESLGIEVRDVIRTGNAAVPVNEHAQVAMAFASGMPAPSATRDDLRAFVEHNGSPGALARATAGAYMILMQSVPARDAYLESNIGRAAEVLPGILGHLRSVPDDVPGDPTFRAALANGCAAAAALAYRTGKGALAQVIIDRALRAEAGHNLSHLLLAAMAAGMPPELLDSLCRAGGDTL